jgi:hypothetical protein
MNRNKALLLLTVLVFSTFLTVSCSLGGKSGLAGGVAGSGNIQTEKREPGTFDAITIEYPGAETLIQQGQSDSVEITADDNLIPQISSEVLDGRLTIKSLAADRKSSVNPTQPVKITITVRELKEIELSAPVATVEVNDIEADTLTLIVSGGAQVRLNRIEVDLFDGLLSGAGDIQVSGSAEEIKLVNSGLGSFNAGELSCDQAAVELSGMGDVTVRVELSLKATITGAGSIYYYGNPSIEQNLNGAGSIKAAEGSDQ